MARNAPNNVLSAEQELQINQPEKHATGLEPGGEYSNIIVLSTPNDNASQYANVHEGTHVYDPRYEREATFGTIAEIEDKIVEQDPQRHEEGAKESSEAFDVVAPEGTNLYGQTRTTSLSSDLAAVEEDNQADNQIEDGTAAAITSNRPENLTSGAIETEVITSAAPEAESADTNTAGITATETESVTLPQNNNEDTDINTAPTANPVFGTVSEDGAAATFDFNASDPNTNDILTYNIPAQPDAGTVINNNDGTFSFDPNGEFETLAEGDSQTVEFSYQVTDTSGANSIANVEITVTGSNDTPEITSTPDTLAVDEGGTFSYQITANDIDNGDTVSVDATLADGSALPDWFTLTQQEDGSYLLSGDPNYDKSGDYDINLTATDSIGASDTQSFTLTVNDIPPLFTDRDVEKGITGNDTINFNEISAGDYEPNTQYSALGGDDHVTLATDSAAAEEAGFNPNREFSAGAGDDTIIAGGLDDKIDGGEGNDLFIFGEDGGTDTVKGGKGGDWTDTIQLQETSIDTTDISGWLTVKGQADYTLDDDGQGLTFNSSDIKGTISLNDGSEINFQDIEKIEWV